jgi:SagB-type dehydrogenase family enzyme
MICRSVFVLAFTASLFAEQDMIKLPAPKLESAVSLESAIAARRSVRDFTQDSLSLEQLSQLLWAGQGITNKEEELRAAPSAGALYPMELRVVAQRVEGLVPGLYVYRHEAHALEAQREPEPGMSFGEAAYMQDWIEEAAVVIFITATPSRTRVKYGERTERYLFLEAGHIGQNILLQAVALGLGGTPVGAFDDDRIARFLGTRQKPLYILPVGHPWEP